MDRIEINIGDTFIRKTPYGGVIKDTIADLSVVNVLDTVNLAYYKDFKIKSSAGIWYELDNTIHICFRLLSPEEGETIKEGIKRWGARKEELKRKVQFGEFSRK